MLKTFFTTLIATFITSLIAIAFVNPGLFSDLRSAVFSNFNLFNIGNNVSEDDNTQEDYSSPDVSSSGPPSLSQELFLEPTEQEQEKGVMIYTTDAIKEAERLIQEALATSDYDKRYILNGIIEKYNLEIETIFNELDSIERAKQRENISAVLSIINRHIFIWEPYYYFPHPESQTPIAKTSTNLKNKHEELMRLLATLDSEETGRIATSYIKFLMEDIAKSGRRNNSDFVRFSYANYQSYKRFFDELAETNNDFKEGFAQEFPTLFNSFYNMHRDVHPGHSEEVRGFLFAMREELIMQHQGVLTELAQKDRGQAEKIVNKVIATLEEQKLLRAQQHEEVRAIIDADLSSYKNLKY